MGTITAVLPILFLLAKPLFGMLVDHFQNQRKLIFMVLIGVQCGAYLLLYFVPFIKNDVKRYDVSLYCDASNSSKSVFCGSVMPCVSSRVNCNWTCEYDSDEISSNFSAFVELAPDYDGKQCFHAYKTNMTMCDSNNQQCGVSCESESQHMCSMRNDNGDLYSKPYFWIFVIFMSMGTIAFNVINSISDAICFDVLGQ